MHISKEGDPYLRKLLVQGAQHILGPFSAAALTTTNRTKILRFIIVGASNNLLRLLVQNYEDGIVRADRLWRVGGAVRRHRIDVVRL